MKTKCKCGVQMLRNETVRNGLKLGVEQFCWKPTQSIYLIIFSNVLNIRKSIPNPCCGQESIFYISLSLFHFLWNTGWQICNTLKRNNSAFKTIHCRQVSDTLFLVVPTTGTTFKIDILLPLFLGKNKSKRKFVVLVFVKNKLFLILRSVKLHSFQLPSHISDNEQDKPLTPAYEVHRRTETMLLIL